MGPSAAAQGPAAAGGDPGGGCRRRRRARGDGPLAVILGTAAAALPGARLVGAEGGDGGYALDLGAAATALPGRLAWAMLDLLRSERLQDLKRCPAPDCGWLFLDRTRNRSRRWCDMASCGNRAKARRHRRGG